ncbi:MAG: hypothetical protein RLZZ338_160 [Cyanobacteriota bacterium]|jgi:hypothetical protein
MVAFFVEMYMMSVLYNATINYENKPIGQYRQEWLINGNGSKKPGFEASRWSERNRVSVLNFG